MDCLGERGQHGLHLEPADQGDRPEADRTHRRGALHRVSPHREYHRVRQSGE